MSNPKKSNSSCFGLFVKSWIISALAMSAFVAGAVGLGIRFLGWSAQSWSEFASWTSYPVLALLGVGVCATGTAFVVATFIGVASAFIGGGKKRGSSGASSSSRAKLPQSHRKTTV